MYACRSQASESLFARRNEETVVMISESGGILPLECRVASSDSSGSSKLSANKLADEWALAEVADGDDVTSGVAICAASLTSVQGSLSVGDGVADCAASKSSVREAATTGGGFNLRLMMTVRLMSGVATTTAASDN